MVRGSSALLAASVSNTWRVRAVKLWSTWEMKRMRWSGGLGVAIAPCICKTSFMELVTSTNGNQCIHDPKNWSGGVGLAIDWSRFVVPRALWCLYELLQESAPFPSPAPERVMFLFLWRPCVWERGSMLEAGLLSLGSAGHTGSLLYG